MKTLSPPSAMPPASDDHQLAPLSPPLRVPGAFPSTRHLPAPFPTTSLPPPFLRLLATPRSPLLQFVAAIVAPEDPKRAEFWTRTSRLWRRDIPAVVMTIGEASAEALAEGKEYGEEWVTWRGADNYYVGKETSLLAMAPALAGQALERFDYDWLLLGVEGTVFNLDTLAQQIRGFDPTLPVMVTDHLWFSYQGSGPRPIERHGSPHAPRCIKCPVHGRKKIPGINWRPTHGCPYCTFAVLKKWDEERPELYNGTNDYKPQLGPEGHLYAYVEGGMVLSRELVRLLNATAVDRCLRNDLARHPTVSGAVALSHCIFSMGIPATDPGPFALDPSFGAFAPLHYGVGDVVRDSRNFARGPDCCDERCEHRLATTASLYIPINDAVNKFKVREAVRALQRARDVFRAARRAETAVGGQIVRGRGAGWCM